MKTRLNKAQARKDLALIEKKIPGALKKMREAIDAGKVHGNWAYIGDENYPDPTSEVYDPEYGNARGCGCLLAHATENPIYGMKLGVFPDYDEEGDRNFEKAIYDVVPGDTAQNCAVLASIRSIINEIIGEEK